MNLARPRPFRVAAGRAIRDQSGVAAVEFGFILPLLLLLYVGVSSLTQAISAARGVTVLSRTLADLVSQQPRDVNITDSIAKDIFASSTIVLAPFSPSSLKMTLSNVEFVVNAAATDSNGYDAKTRWTVSFSNGTLRPCGTNPKLTWVPNTSKPSATTMPLGLYAAGFLIVADVSYTYTPGLFNWGNANGQSTTFTTFNMNRTTYMRPRQTDNIRYTPSTASNTASICNIASPQTS